MRYIVDHDLHTHSKISLCSNDEGQTLERILHYGEKNKLKTLCLTDHFWDENIKSDLNEFYKLQNFAHIEKALPLPKSEKTNFLFGCEIDIDKCLNVGISDKIFDKFDFVIIPTTHLHMTNFTISEQDAKSISKRAELWVERFEAVLDSDLPFEKIGIAHLTCFLMAPNNEEYLKVLDLLPTKKLEDLFAKAAKLGVGIELNIAINELNYPANKLEKIMRIYRIAKAQGCKFYLGSDAHHPEDFEVAMERFEKIVDILELTEDDKFVLK